MTEREAFLKAICDSPDDDTPRLVYADWLTEHGEPERAEFIRVQCELARLPGCRHKAAHEVRHADGRVDYQYGPDCGECGRCVRHAELESRSLAMVEAFRMDWILPPPWMTQAEWTQAEWDAVDLLDRPGVCTFRRGFVHSVRCSGDEWARHGDAVLREHPVREVVVTQPAAYAVRAARSTLRLAADPEERAFDHAAVRVAVGAAHGSWIVALDEGVVSLALLRLRWPGVTFRPAE